MLPGTWREEEPPSNEQERKRYEYERRIPQTGWVGAGVQGSFLWEPFLGMALKKEYGTVILGLDAIYTMRLLGNAPQSQRGEQD